MTKIRKRIALKELFHLNNYPYFLFHKCCILHMLFHKDTCPIRNLIPLGPFGHIMPTSPYRLSSGSRNGYSLSSSFLERYKGACLMELLISLYETRSSNSIKQVVSDGGINCSTRWNTLLTI